MSAIKWIKILMILFVLCMGFIAIFNYMIDPYSLYKTKYFSFEKIKQSDKMKFIKAITVKEIKPVSILLGSSRAEYGYDPTHQYFLKPSYNLATAGSSMYENRLYLQWALKQGNLRKVLLVADYRMFINLTQKSKYFETNFDDKNIYSLLFNIDVLKDSLGTIRKKKGNITKYLENGQLEHTYNWQNIVQDGGHLEKMRKDESTYYKDYSKIYRYKDTQKDSFPDFEEIIKLCYENNIELDIVFGPSHIRQWEALNYYLGIDNWFQWKKDVVISVDEIAKKYNKEPFRIMDFSVYHLLTAESIPVDKNIQMKYHWEASHYKNELGLIVLDRLIANSESKDFGVELNIKNIDQHLEQQKIDRYKFINTEKYKIEFEEYLNLSHKIEKN